MENSVGHRLKNLGPSQKIFLPADVFSWLWAAGFEQATKAVWLNKYALHNFSPLNLLEGVKPHGT